jgi:histidine kinase/DNA gyrase B/HSP90-like ATPase/double zinc ribbon protein
MQCPRCQQDNPAPAKFCVECGTPLAGSATARPYADLWDENELIRRSLNDALRKQAATSEILEAISEAQIDVQAVLDAIREARCVCARPLVVPTCRSLNSREAGHQEQVFEEFRQVGTTAKKMEGTGLGLALCRRFVELHGGRIWVKSQVGVGSTFTFTIPGGGSE